MVLTTLISLFGGAGFRMLWGEISNWLTARQQHKQEIERLRLQEEIDAAQHNRNLESTRLQADLKVQEITRKGEVDLSLLDAEIFSKGVEGVNKLTGITFIDIWKSSIQPALATMVMFMILKHYHGRDWVMDEHAWELAGGVLGVFIADRLLFKRGK